MSLTGFCQLPDDVVAAIVLRAFRVSGATLQAHLDMSLVCRCGRVNTALPMLHISRGAECVRQLCHNC